MLFQDNGKKFYNKRSTINLGGELISLASPQVMGILNVTPDSFYDGGRYLTEAEMVDRGREIVEQGGSVIDIGGCSTRPGAEAVDAAEELKRLLPAVIRIRKEFPGVALSVDSFRSDVVEKLYDAAGDFIVNDISGGTMDGQMFATVARLRLPYILMHIQGTPATMQQNPHYNDVTQEVILSLSAKVDQLKLLGVNDIIIDPGFGFGKNSAHNFELLNRLDAFNLFELPLLAGLSRKSMIWRTLNITAGDALNGTSVLHTLALMGGADILRVHDVKEAVQAIQLVAKTKASCL